MEEKYSYAIISVITIFVGILLFNIFLGGTQMIQTTQNQEGNHSSSTVEETIEKEANNMIVLRPMEGDIEVLIRDLEIPWDIAFLPDGDILVTQRPGTLSRFKKDGSEITLNVENIKHVGEGGLLGMVIHPNFVENNLLYLYITGVDSEDKGTINRVERYRLEDDTLVEKTVVIDNIPGARFHHGGRIEFGPDGLLYVATGDATDPDIAQDLSSLGGKILRVMDDGTIPRGNPFGTIVYSYGHRSPQGLTWDTSGNLWQTEHGRSGALSGLDEVNLIEKGQNYGWPVIQGDETKSGMQTPKLNSGANVTWAPASAAYLKGSIFFGGLRGARLYEAVLDGEEVVELREHLVNVYGRIRTVRIGPDGMIYIMTSNKDGRGTQKNGDDKIIRINPDIF